METLIKVAQFFLSLSILIALHEWGHYFFARLFKTRVNKFYLFFDFLFPMPNVLNFALFKKKKGDTEYGIGWFPLGGYVQIDGMMDETQDAEKLKSPPQPWEFRSKPAWQRLLIMMGGILVNVVLAFIIYALVLWGWGEKKILNASLKNGIAVSDTFMYSKGFRDGDKLVAVNGEPIVYFEDAMKKMILKGEEARVTLNRNGTDTTVLLAKNILGELSTRKIDRRGLIRIAYDAVVDSVDTKGPSFGKLSAGDRIVKINNDTVTYYHHIMRLLEGLKSSDSIVQVGYLRSGTAGIQTATIKIGAERKLGISKTLDPEKMEKAGLIRFESKTYSFFASFPAGVRKTWETLVDYIDQFKLIFKPSTGAYKGMGGFASMTQVFSSHWDWESFWTRTAMFSIILAFMNFLPIPMLDGGYILFTLFEIVTGKKVPDRFLEKANMIGFFIIIGLMVFANGNDIFRKLKGWF